MSGDVLVRAHGLGKMYRIYARPQDRLKQMLLSRLGHSYGTPFWALNGVSLEVHRGETVGIIGRNGSGKSTLLQLLAGTLTPSTGELEVRGRVAALLELGTGFNPEFTGRENVIMNATILGLSREALESRMEEITAFADIGSFVDQPVKLYSSGMLVRLAFAVATSVDADLLLIDEALAVGDVFFRQRCYERLQALRERGVSILLASHSMQEIQEFCGRALLLEHGRATFVGASAEAVSYYYHHCQPSRAAAAPVITPTDEGWLDLSAVAQVSNDGARCVRVAVRDSDGRPCRSFQQGETASFVYEFEVQEDLDVPVGGVQLQDERNTIVHGKNSLQYDLGRPGPVPREGRVRFQMDVALELAWGEYTFSLGFASIDGETYERRGDIPHAELEAKLVRRCHLSNVASFAVVPRREGHPTELLHHGLANLPGRCRLEVLSSSAARPPVATEQGEFVQ
jgi:lipopolysaccharide transport system ATP-binding protein